MADRRIDAGWTIVLVTAAFNLAIALFCPSAQDATGHHWLHGIEHSELPGVFIVWGVGLVFFVSGRRQGNPGEYVGYLLLVLSAFYAGRLCFFT